MRIEVLGPVQLCSDEGVPVEVAERHLRLLLSSLVAAEGEPVSADALIQRLWPREQPADPKKVLQAKLSRLRTALDRAGPGGRDLLRHTPAGYRLALEPGVLDAHRFREAVGQARRMTTSTEKVKLLTSALELWRGDPFGDAAEEIWLGPVLTALHGVRGDALEELVQTLVEAGDPQRALRWANEALRDYPTREGLVGSVMTALYQAGRQREALETFDRLRRHLADELGVDPTPRLRELHGRILRQDPVLMAPPGTRTSGTASFPAETYALIGRERETAELTQLLSRSRLVTITGIGGVGKTRLAQRVARDLASDLERGAWFVDLTQLTPATAEQAAVGERVATLVTTALGLQSPDPTPGLMGQLADALGARSALLVLDNCEHVLAEATAFTTDLLRRSPAVRVLATSREALGLAEEQRFEARALDTDPRGGGPSEAASFFTERARASDPDFRLDPGNTEAVEQLCRRLDGLPLALELAAARIRALPVVDLLDRLDDRLNLLQRPGHAAPPRQQTLRAMIDWSWSLLDDTERAVLRRLAVHPGTMGLDAAEAICADDPATADGSASTQRPTVAREQVIDHLLRLVDRSLVTTVPTSTGIRYGLLESIAVFAREHLEAAGEREATAARHAQHYAEFARAAEAGWRTRHQHRWLARFRVEHPHLVLAFGAATRLGDGRSAAAMLFASFWFQLSVPGFSIAPWMVCTPTRTGQHLRRLLAVDGLSPDDRATATTLVACTELGVDGPSVIDAALAGFVDDTVARARVQWFAGASLLAADHRDVGERHLDEALASLADQGQDWDLAVAACRRDWLLLTLWRETPRGLPDGRPVRAVLREADAGYGTMYAWAVAHRSAELVGDHQHSASAVAAALATSRELGIDHEVALWLTSAAIAALRDGDSDQALRLVEESRTVGGDLGFPAISAYADLAESMIHRHLGDLARARVLLDRWRAIPVAARAELLTEFEHGFLAVAEGDLAAALLALNDLVTRTPVEAQSGTTARMLELAAAVRLLGGQPRQAAELLGAAEASRSRTPHGPSVPEHADSKAVRAGLRAALSQEALSAALAHGAACDPATLLRESPHQVPAHATS